MFKPGTKVSNPPIVLLFFRQKMKNIDKEEGEEVLPGVKRIILVLSGTTVVR